MIELSAGAISTCSPKCEQALQAIAAKCPLPDGPYDLFYADPPWPFRMYSDKGQGRSASRHYPPLVQAIAPPGRMSSRDLPLMTRMTTARLTMIDQQRSATVKCAFHTIAEDGSITITIQWKLDRPLYDRVRAKHRLVIALPDLMVGGMPDAVIRAGRDARTLTSIVDALAGGGERPTFKAPAAMYAWAYGRKAILTCERRQSAQGFVYLLPVHVSPIPSEEFPK